MSDDRKATQQSDPVNHAGMEQSAQTSLEQDFFDLAERFRRSTDPAEVNQLGHQLGRMVFTPAGKQ